MNEDVIVLKTLQKPNTWKCISRRILTGILSKKNKKIENLSQNLCSKLFSALSLKHCPIPQPNPNP